MQPARGKKMTQCAEAHSYRTDETPDKLHREMKAFAAKLKKNPKEAKSFLVRAGIVTGTGKLKKVYKQARKK
ncbi:hypothetical protein [Thiohalomonas denitrificans]|uniref:hypothetical protein n=1 Tax=Thiohalomonas denitrificans TaxID=415747 RepID=UPI0026EDF120|nr:hypothetical protein [Thiohalomonas denitrificans]